MSSLVYVATIYFRQEMIDFSTLHCRYTQKMLINFHLPQSNKRLIDPILLYSYTPSYCTSHITQAS